jgi:hypothetical protein
MTLVGEEEWDGIGCGIFIGCRGFQGGVLEQRKRAGRAGEGTRLCSFSSQGVRLTPRAPSTHSLDSTLKGALHFRSQPMSAVPLLFVLGEQESRSER